MVGCEVCSERSFWSRWRPSLGKHGSCYRRLSEAAMGYVKGPIDLKFHAGRPTSRTGPAVAPRHARPTLAVLSTERERESARTFNWSMLRLVQHGLITRLNV